MYSSHKSPPPYVAEITVVSAEGLMPFSSVFSLRRRRLRPFITLSTVAPRVHYKTSVASVDYPTWGDASFRIPFDIFPDGSFVFLRLFTERLFLGPALIGWCRVPAADVGQPPVGPVRHLSYRLRDRDGSRSRVIVNLAVKLESQAAEEPCRTVIGLPAAVLR